MSFRSSELARLLTDLEAVELSLRTNRAAAIEQMAKTLAYIIMTPELADQPSLGQLDRKRRRLLEFGDRLIRETVTLLTEVNYVNDLTDLAVAAVAQSQKADESAASTRKFDAITGRDFIERHRGGHPLPGSSLNFHQVGETLLSDRGATRSAASTLDPCDPFHFVDSDGDVLMASV